MLIEEQKTEPIPTIPAYSQHTPVDYQRLKAISDASGLRLLHVYLLSQGRYVNPGLMQVRKK